MCCIPCSSAQAFSTLWSSRRNSCLSSSAAASSSRYRADPAAALLLCCDDCPQNDHVAEDAVVATPLSELPPLKSSSGSETEDEDAAAVHERVWGRAGSSAPAPRVIAPSPSARVAGLSGWVGLGSSRKNMACF